MAVIYKHRFILILVAATVAICGFSCGRSGDDDSSEVAPSEPADPGSVGDQGLVDIKGKVVTTSGSAGETEMQATPAAGYQVWLTNHTSGDLTRVVLPKAATFAFPVAELSSGHVYSITIVSGDLVIVGDIDFSSQEGIQSALEYRGGLGFDLGEIVVRVDAAGRIDRTNLDLYGTVAGGFSLADDSELGFADRVQPPGIASFRAGSDLVVLDPATLLSSFYRVVSDSDAYARALATWSAISLELIAEDEEAIAGLFVEAAGAWTRGARYILDAGGFPSDGTAWAETGASLRRSGSDRFFARVFPGKVPDPGVTLLFRVIPKGGESFLVPVSEMAIFGFPPYVNAVGSGSGEPPTIDYTDNDNENGLSRPHCLGTNDLVVDTMPPLDTDGNPIVQNVAPLITISLSYFGAGGDRLAPLPDDYPDVFQSEVTDSPYPGVTRTWSPSEGRATFILDSETFANPLHRLHIWNNLLLAKIGDKPVDEIRTDLIYGHPNLPRRAGVGIWFKKKC